MTSYTKKECERYSLYRSRVCETLGIERKDYNYLRIQGKRLHAIYEKECNGTAEQADNVAERCAMQRAQERAVAFGLEIYFQTDPRGAAIYVDSKPIARNAYTGAKCIY